MRLRNHPHFWTVIAGIILTLYIIAGAVALAYQLKGLS